MSRRQEPPGDSRAGRQPLPPPAPGRSASHSVTCSQCGRLNFTTGSLCNDCQRGPAARLERRHSSEADRHYYSHSHQPSSSPSTPISGGRKRGSNGEVRRASSVDNRSPLNGTARSPRPSETARPRPSPSHDRRSGDRHNGSGLKGTMWRTEDTRRGSTLTGASTNSHSSPRNGQRDTASTSNTVVLTESATEKQPSRVSKEPEVIDLISSDEESSTNSQASKLSARTAQGSGGGPRSRKLSQAAQGDAVSSRNGDPPSKSVPSSSISSHPSPPPPSSSQPLPPPTSAHTASSSSDSSNGEAAPRMSRRFPDVNFVVTDFPTDAEANAARKRGGSEHATTTQPKQGTSPAVPPAGETPAPEPPVAADSTHDMTQEPSPTPAAEVSAPPDAPQIPPPPVQSEPVVAAAPAPSAAVAAKGGGGQAIPAAYAPIVIDDSQENIVVEEAGSSLFMSRAFPTVEFNAADFPVHGIGIARRTVLPRHPSSAASEVATEASSTTSEPPSRAPSHETPPNEPVNGGVAHVPLPSVSVAATPATSDDAAATPASQRTNDAAIDAPSGTAGAPVTPAPTPAVDQAPPATVTPLIKIEKKSSLTPILRIVSKPKTLGECSPEFLVIMKESGGESYMDDDEVWRQQQLQLLDVVDLTAISDSEDDESDGDVVLVTISQTRKNPAVDLITAPIAAQMSSTAGSTAASVKAEGATDAKSSAPQTVEKAECMICEKHQSVRLMVLCGICGLYYHRRCAREHGGSVRCWNCEPDDMIDDTELTETARDQAIGILSVFRQLSPDSEDEEMEDAGVQEDGEAEGGETAAAANSSTGGEDGDDDEGEDMDISADESEENPLLAAGETKTDRRWRSFLTESTAALDAHFHEVTRSITAELQTEEGRSRYSRGFTSPAEFNAGMNDIVNHYVQREREQQRAVQQASAAAIAAIAAQAAAAAEAAATPGATASAPSTAPATATAPIDAERNTTGPEGVSSSPAIGSAGDASTLQTTNVDAAGRSATAIPATGGA